MSETVTDLTNPVICTFSGYYVNPLELEPLQIDPTDVAHALSNQCRFSGHTSEFYSVAEHSVRVAKWLDSIGQPTGVVKWGLLHDASEAYLVDIPRPLKVHPYFGKAYRGAEGRAMRAVCVAFGLDPTNGVMPDIVKTADVLLLATERRDLMPPGVEWESLAGVEPLEDVIHTWSPKKARERFSSMLAELEAREREETA